MAGIRMQYMNVPKMVGVIPIRRKTVNRICNPRSDPKVSKYFDISAPEYSFGPFYPESKTSAEAKDSAWKKIIEMEKMGEERTIQNYMAAMRKVEKETIAAYGSDDVLLNLTESKFRWMMIKDGCFFLQLTLYLLNDSGEMDLGYPDEDDIFGIKRSPKTFLGLIKSMFLLGNQIPVVVLSELMNQEYFRARIASVKWWNRPSDMLSKQLLYDLLVDPVIPQNKSSWTAKNAQTTSSKILNLLRSEACWSIHAEKTPYNSSHREKPSDLLHGLQLFLLGPAAGNDKKSAGDTGERLDEELGDNDLEAGIKLRSSNRKTHNIDNLELRREEELESKYRKQFFSQFIATQEELQNNKQLTASNLTKKGIYIWNNSKGGGGSRGIDFKNRFLWGSLFMPPLKVNYDTNVLFTNLKYYEIVHQQKEATSYINFLANLVSSYEDVNVLATNKVIDENTKSEDKQRFLDMLRNLTDEEVISVTNRHHSVIGRVKDYSVFPWEKFKYVAIVVFFLAILQTIFGILSYIVGRDQLHQQESSSSASSTGVKFQFP